MMHAFLVRAPMECSLCCMWHVCGDVVCGDVVCGDVVCGDVVCGFCNEMMVYVPHSLCVEGPLSGCTHMGVWWRRPGVCEVHTCSVLCVHCAVRAVSYTCVVFMLLVYAAVTTTCICYGCIL